jgi:hypothetical protein
MPCQRPWCGNAVDHSGSCRLCWKGAENGAPKGPAASDDRFPFPAFSGLAVSLFFGLALSQKGKECETGTSTRSTRPASSMTVTDTLFKEQ